MQVLQQLSLWEKLQDPMQEAEEEDVKELTQT